MELYLDTGDLHEVEQVIALGVLSGVTTNPSLLSKGGFRDFRETIQQFCALVPGPVSAEVLAQNHEEMLAEAREIATWAPNVVVKLPMTIDGLKTLHSLGGSVPTNVTLVFSPN
ncbi:MAG TPA: transaldolase family protein, partial [Chloroflexota bacterium]